MPSSLDPDYPPQCQLCEFYTHNPHLCCTLHPLGLESEECHDYKATAPHSYQKRIAPLLKPEEQWQPEGMSRLFMNDFNTLNIRSYKSNVSKRFS